MSEEKQFNFTIAEGHELPSGGKIYDKPVSSHVELRSMTARDEMKRLAPTTSQFKRMADVIEGCLIEKPGVSVYDMSLGDYEFLLHKLRIVTYGPDYKMTLICPHCGKQYDTVANLDNLQLKEFDYAKFSELQTFTLPVSKDNVKIKFQTPRILDEIEAKTKEMKRKFKGVDIEFDILVLLECIIDEVNGTKLDMVKLETYINKMPAADMNKIINNLDKLNECIGINSEIYVDCPHCARESKTFFRFGPEFFRPTTD